MADFPDFSSPVWDKRDTAAKEGTIKSWSWVSGEEIPPVGLYEGDIYTVPAGKIFYSSDSGMAMNYRGWMQYKIKDGAEICSALMEAWDTKIISFAAPFVIVAGETLQWQTSNWDIVSGYPYGYFFGWEEPGSKPEKPKNDEPEERYKLGDFNRANLCFLPNKETLIMFNSLREDKMNYLRIRDFGRPGQKKIASFHLKGKEATEIINTTHASPQKVKAVLEKYERKYAKIKIR